MDSLLIKFPEKMVQKMNQIVNTGKYGSRSELIRESVRIRIEQIGKTAGA